ncbi:MAG: hypothetical protein IT373_11070 [Polyangiaceae bacterium]|nr:hypothetical protein [Polyangiaceae bacterium]
MQTSLSMGFGALGLLGLCACSSVEFPSSFTDGLWTFSVDAVWQGSATPASDALDASDYEDTSVGRLFLVTLSAQTGAVELEELLGSFYATGARGADVDERMHYDLTSSVVVGGRFEVWEEHANGWGIDKVRAELTLYGSDWAVASSELGGLRQ